MKTAKTRHPPLILEQTAPAKINLGLHVLRKRKDGYHDLETVFLRIGWTDVLRVQQADALDMTCSDPRLPTDGRNLCMKAAQLLAQTYQVNQGVHIHLEKRIPYGAGLGGGSSDAATTLHLLNKLWGLDLASRDLHPLAAQLGSDVPFFLETTAAYGRGRGEILTPLLIPQTREPYTFPYHLVVVVPDVHVSTADAYRRVQPNAHDRADLCNVVCSNDVSRWTEELVNDFEPSVFAQYPSLSAVKAEMIEDGADYAVMSGSGAAIVSVFVAASQAKKVARHFAQKAMRVWTSA